MRIVIFALFIPLVGFLAEASLRTNYFKASFSPKNFIKKGVFVGGKTSQPTSLLDIKLMKSKKTKKERFVIRFADLLGKEQGVRTNYYQVYVKDKPARLVIDLENVHKTGVGPEELRRKLRRSKWVISSDITMDPVDHSTSLVFHFVHSLQFSVFSPKEKSNTIYIDMKEAL